MGMPDLIEVLPGTIYKVIARLSRELPVPLIAGGLLADKADVTAALSAPAPCVFPPATRSCGTCDGGVSGAGGGPVCGVSDHGSDRGQRRPGEIRLHRRVSGVFRAVCLPGRQPPDARRHGSDPGSRHVFAAAERPLRRGSGPVLRGPGPVSGPDLPAERRTDPVASAAGAGAGSLDRACGPWGFCRR